MLRTGSRKFNYLLSKNLNSAEISAELLSMCKTFLQKVYIDYFRSNAIIFSGDFMENIKLSGAKNVRDIVTDDYSVSQLKKVFEVIADTDREKAVLWHCTEGKDRCGITSALFLSLMNVDTKASK